MNNKPVFDWIDEHEKDIIADLSDIAAIRSVSDANSEVKPFGPGCREVLAKMLKKGEDAGYETKDYDHMVGAISREKNADITKSIGVWAHLDVVPEGEGWLTDPYTPTIKDGMLFGRGVSDNKSAAIGTFYVLKAFDALDIKLKHNIILYLGTSEETGMADVCHYVEHYPVPQFSLVPDAGYPGACGEFGRVQYKVVSNQTLSDDIVALHSGSVFNIIPNEATIEIRKNDQLDLGVIPEKGYDVIDNGDTVTIIAHGVSSHAAFPEGGTNAIRKLTEVLVKLPGIQESDRQIFDFINHVNDDPYGTFLGFAKSDDISGQTVSSGTVLEVIDGHVYLTNDCRHCVTDTNERVIDAITSTCEKHDFHMEIMMTSKPYYIDVNGKEAKTISRLVSEFTGNSVAMRIGKGGTYAGKIPNAVATGMSVPRPGDHKPEFLAPGHGGAHQPDEFLRIRNYLDGMKLFATILLELDEILD